MKFLALAIALAFAAPLAAHAQRNVNPTYNGAVIVVPSQQ